MGGPHDRAWLVSVFRAQLRGSVREWARDQSQLSEAGSRDRTVLLMGDCPARGCQPGHRRLPGPAGGSLP